MFKTKNNTILIYIKYITTLLIINSVIISAGLAQITGRIVTDDSKIRYKANTVVYIEYVEAIFSPPEKNPIVDQLGLKFVPHVLPVVVGTSVDFLNSDDVLHNVFSPDSCAGKFNLGTWPKNETNTYKYEKIGCEAVLLCNVHPEMEAYVIVLQNPYFAVSDEEGTFKIENVPPGEYTVKVWNEKLRAIEKHINVPESGTIQLNFKLIKQL